MRPHHRLEAWSKSVDLVTEVYKGLTSQIRRAAGFNTREHRRRSRTAFSKGVRLFSLGRAGIRQRAADRANHRAQAGLSRRGHLLAFDFGTGENWQTHNRFIASRNNAEADTDKTEVGSRIHESFQAFTIN